MSYAQVGAQGSFSMGLPHGGYQSLQGNPANNTIFKKRYDRIDWKKLAGADVDHISRNLDYFTLQENIHNVAFCSIESELDLRSVDSNFVKLFKLAQLTIEYLLFSQDYLNSKGKELEAVLKKEREEHEVTKKKVDKFQNELSEVKKESHKRKKMIVAQQQMLQAGPNSYNKCPFCSKAFVNTSFLQSHLMRRHLDSVGSYNSMITSQAQQQQPPQLPQQSASPQQPLSQSVPLLPGNDNNNANATVDNTMNEALVKQMEEIRERLRLTESQLVEERNARNTMLQKDKFEQSQRETEIQREMSEWKADQAQQHKEEMDRMREMFMRELKEMNEKYNTAESNLQEMQRNISKRGSSLGQLEDDNDREQLAKQREEVAVLKEELLQQVTHVENVMERKMQKKEEEWKTKIKQMSREHEQRLKQMRSALESSMTELERERENKDAVENTYLQQVEDLQQLIQQSKETEKKMREHERPQTESNKPSTSGNRPTSAPPQTPQQPVYTPTTPTAPEYESEEDDDDATTELEATESFEGTSTYGTRTLPTSKQSKETEKKMREHERPQTESNKPSTSGNRPTSAPPQTPQQPVYTPTTPTAPEYESEEDDDDATTELEATESFEGTSTYGTRTLPTMGTLSLSEMKNQRLSDLLKQNPNIIKQMKGQLRRVIDQELEKRGVPATSKGLTTSTFNNKMALLKTERQQTAKKHRNFFEIRQHYINQVELLAKEKVKTQTPAKQQPKTSPSKPSRPTSAPVKTSPEKARLGQSAPLPTTAVPEPKRSSAPPLPAPRATSPPGHGKNATSMSASSFTATSTNWDSDLDDEETTNGDNTGPRVAAPAKPSKQVRYEDEEEDDDDSYLEEISELEDGVDIQPDSGLSKPITVMKPKGGMVAELSRSIELQLQGRGKKPVGGVNTMSLEDESKSAAGRNSSQKSEDDDSFSLSSVEDEEESASPAPKPSPRRSAATRSSLAADTASYSTNTYGTSMWGSSKAPPSTAQPAGPATHTQGSIGKTSVNISDWGSDNEFDLDELGSP